MKDKVIPKEEIEKLKVETEQQLNYARQQQSKAQVEMILWSKKVEQFIGSLATCNVILSKAKLEEVIKKEKNG